MTQEETKKTESEYSYVFTEDLFDAVCLCHAALAQDAPEDERYYLNAVLGMLFGYLPTSQRAALDVYLAEKKYLPPEPPSRLILPDTVLP